MTGLQPLRREERDRVIGITTTVPVEVIYAAGFVPVDLNNVFIGSGLAERLIAEAEARGFPRSSCAWAKGVYAAARRLRLRRVVAVMQGDCSNTHAVAEVLRADGVEVVPFSFPTDPSDAEFMQFTLRRFAAALGTTLDASEEWRARLDRLRALAHQVDRLAWSEGRVSGEELHVWTISCSDFFGSPERFEVEAKAFLRTAGNRTAFTQGIRLALLGIPPICANLFSFLEKRGVRVVFDEVPRQFAMPFASSSLNEQYRRYTYPYDIFHRLADMRAEIARRLIHGAIHYVQSFCHRQVQDAILRDALSLPILTLEGDRPGPLEASHETRIEAFLELLEQRRRD